MPNDNLGSGSSYKTEEFQKQNILLALIGGSLAAFVSAVIWAGIAISTGVQIGWMAVGLGILVGFAVRLGNGVTDTYRYIGAILALVGCILGYFFTMVGFISKEAHIGILEVLNQIDYSKVPSEMLRNSSPVSILFYVIAVVEGYKFAVKTTHAI